MEENQLQAAPKKTEIFSLNGKRLGDFSIRVGNEEIVPTDRLKYLGVKFDRGQRSRKHITTVTDKALRVLAALSRIMPNIGGAGHKTSILYYRLLESIERLALYGLEKRCRRLRQGTFRATSRHLEDADVERKKEDIKRALSRKWQERWDRECGNKVTHDWISNIEKWLTRPNGQMNYHLTQAMTGHGCFGAYLHRIGRIYSAECWYRCQVIDDVEHTFHTCVRWEDKRAELRRALGVQDLTIPLMGRLRRQNLESWTLIKEFLTYALKDKEEYKRAMDRAARMNAPTPPPSPLP
ncbi:uncharacterized protein LOC128882808 [Hylaeus volcanicus]|uniref:uncharacterized protein LOC128882808 n=1 Tax=Hylaeus volcanicus TaxID=313075 RepID=UPI0023B7CBA8|nr:uncharacterized protein LOC128882808 [Hylaeus volcanicus]